VSASSSTEKNLAKEDSTEPTKTLIRWNKNYTSSGSPVRSEILRPRSTKNETVEAFSWPCIIIIIIIIIMNLKSRYRS